MKTYILYICRLLFVFIPETRGFGFKRWMLRLSGACIGENVRVCSSVKIYGNKQLSIGDNSWIGHECFIMCSENISIGKNVNIAPRCYIGTGTHEITPDSDSVAGRGMSIPIYIGDGCWICASSTILAGSQIGEKSIVAAGTVVKGKVENREIVGGGLAKHIRYI